MKRSGPPDISPAGRSLGYPRYSGYAWYRTKINVEGASRPLALKDARRFRRRLPGLRQWTTDWVLRQIHAHHVIAYAPLPQDFRLPKGVDNGTITIAIRMWMDSATRFNAPDAGGLHGPPLLGYASSSERSRSWTSSTNAKNFVTGFIESMILFMALLLTLALFWLDREEKAYFWLALVCLVTLVSNTSFSLQGLSLRGLGKLAVVTPDRCHLHAAAHRAMGHLLGLLVPLVEDGPTAMASVVRSGDSYGRYGYAPPTALWAACSHARCELHQSCSADCEAISRSLALFHHLSAASPGRRRGAGWLLLQSSLYFSRIISMRCVSSTYSGHSPVSRFWVSIYLWERLRPWSHC